MAELEYYVHPSAVIDEGAAIGAGSKIWHFSHIMSAAVIGRNCVVSQGCFIANVEIGDGVRIQNHVSVYESVRLEDDVFCGPSCVFTNVVNPRAAIARKEEYRSTLVRRGASIGANATIVCGATIGEFSFIGAGAVVLGIVLPRALMVGVPARQIGWSCDCGVRMEVSGNRGHCRACGADYQITSAGAFPSGMLRS